MSDDQQVATCPMSHEATAGHRFCAGCGSPLPGGVVTPASPEPEARLDSTVEPDTTIARGAGSEPERPRGTIGIACWSCRSTIVSPLLWQQPDGAPYGVECRHCAQQVVLHSCSNCQTRHYVALTQSPDDHPPIPGLEIEGPPGNYSCSTCGRNNPISLPEYRDGKPTKYFFHLCGRCRHWVKAHGSAPAISCGDCGYAWTVAHCPSCSSFNVLPYSAKGAYACICCRAGIPSSPLRPVAARAVDTTTVLAAEIQYDSTIENANRDKTIAALVADLDRLVGLSDVKEQVRRLVDLAKVSAARRGKGLPAPAISNHLVFVGNPGTGKTTVARIIARLYHQLGLLSSDEVTETSREGLVAGYVGQTAIKTMAVCEAALGGVLFIDEAYSLAGSSSNDFGPEAVSTLLKYMEDHRDDLVVILAGYPADMAVLLASNAGLASRFSRTIAFSDYSIDELAVIFVDICGRSGYSVSDAGLAAARAAFSAWPRDRGFGNGRLARTLYEQGVMAQAGRLSVALTPDSDLVTLMAEDVDAAAAGLSSTISPAAA